MVAKIMKDINDSSGKVADCLKTNKDGLVKIEEEVMGKLKQCVDEKVTGFIAAVAEIKDSILKLVDVSKSLKEDVRNCNGGVACTAKEVFKLVKSIAEVPISIVKLISKATQLFDGTKDALETCASNTAVSVGMNNADIALKIGDCVTN